WFRVSGSEFLVRVQGSCSEFAVRGSRFAVPVPRFSRRLDPVARSGATARGAIARVGELAAIEREATASDTLAEGRLHPFELGDPFLDAFRPAAGKLYPVGTFRRAVAWEPRQLGADFLQRQAHFLSEDDERHESKHGARVSPVPGIGPFRGYQALIFVEAQRGGRHAA